MATAIQALTVEELEALMAGPEVYRERFGLAVAEDYLDSPEVLGASRLALLRGVEAEWFSHLILDPDAGAVVGFGGFKGPPVEGEVEIGYSVAPAHRGRGHATAAVREMIARARDSGVRTVTAHTLPEDNASTRLLGRLSFQRDGLARHRGDGYVWRWALRL